MHFLYWNEESASEPGNTRYHRRQTECSYGEGTDESDEEWRPALVEGKVHYHQLAEYGAIVRRSVDQLKGEREGGIIL